MDTTGPPPLGPAEGDGQLGDEFGGESGSSRGGGGQDRARRHVRWWLAIPAVVVVAGVGITGYLLSRESQAKQVTLAAAVSKTRAITSLRFEFDTDLGQGTIIPLTGAADLTAKLISVSLTANGLAAVPDGSTVSAYFDNANRVMYLGGGYIESQLASGKKYLRVGLETLGAATGFNIGQLGSALEINPMGALALAARADQTTDVGPEVILDGVDAEHVQIQVDTSALLTALNANGDRSLATQVSSLPKTMAYDLWVDDDDYIRQIRAEVPLSGGTRSYTIRFTEINPKLSLTLPTAAESFDIGRLLGGG